MAKTFTPPFGQTGFDPPQTEIAAATTSLSTGTGTSILTASADDAEFYGIAFKAQQEITNPTKVVIFSVTSGGTRELIGEILIGTGIVPDERVLSWQDKWLHPHYEMTGRPWIIDAGDSIECAYWGSTAQKITAIPIGYQFS